MISEFEILDLLNEEKYEECIKNINSSLQVDSYNPAYYFYRFLAYNQDYIHMDFNAPMDEIDLNKAIELGGDSYIKEYNFFKLLDKEILMLFLCAKRKAKEDLDALRKDKIYVLQIKEENIHFLEEYIETLFVAALRLTEDLLLHSVRIDIIELPDEEEAEALNRVLDKENVEAMIQKQKEYERNYEGYNQAKAFYDEEAFTKAYLLFKSFDSFLDSEKYILACEQIFDKDYQRLKEAVDSNSYNDDYIGRLPNTCYLGFRNTEELVRKNEENKRLFEKKKKQKKIKFILSLTSIGIALISVLIVLSIFIFIPRIRYNMAQGYIDNKEYEKAMDILSGLDYSDSKVLLDMLYVNEALENEDYEDAMVLIVKNGGKVQANYAFEYEKFYSDYESYVALGPKTISINKTGYTQTGWKIEQYDFDIRGAFLSIRLLPVYDSCVYSLTYNLNGGVMSASYPKEYTINDVIKIENPTKEGYTFLGWSGTGLSSNTLNLTLKDDVGDRIFNAEFEANTNTPYKVIHYKQNEGNSDYSILDEENLAGTTDTLTEASPKSISGYAVKDFSQEAILGDGSTVVEIYYAHTGVISLESNNPSAGTISGAGSYKIGSSVTLTASENEGYTFLGWYNGNTLLSSDLEYTFTLDEAEMTILAVFNYYTLSTEKNIDSAGNISEYNKVKITAGKSITLTATLKDGYTFLGWYNGDTLLSSDLEYTFTMPNLDITYTAKYEKTV